MSARRSSAAALAAPAAVALAIVVAAAAAFWLDLAPAERAALAAALTPARIGVFVLFATGLLAALGYLAWRADSRTAGAARRIAEGAALIARGNAAHRVAEEGAPALQDLARALNALADERSRVLGEAQTAVAAANAGLEAEKQRLAALIAELDQSVVVCNPEGRILLYNQAARALVGADPGGAALGLGRSVFGILDRAAVLHAIESMARQVERNERQGTHFVTATPAGRLLRVQAAPVAGGPSAELGGYVLLLTDVTDSVDAAASRVAIFQGLVEGTRSALASIRAAIENLLEHPDMDPARRVRFIGIVREEAGHLTERLHALSADVSERLKVQWPLEDMRGEDLVTLARSRIERRAALPVKLEDVDPDLWLRVDSFSLAQGFCYVAQRLKDEFDVREVRFRLAAAGEHAQLDLLWRGAPLATETAFAWQHDAFTMGGEDSPLTLRQVIERHGGEAWHQRDLPAQLAYFRFLLPLAASRSVAPARAAGASRPEFYDFDLFSRSSANDALDQRRLADLAYTVFDTETTGLSPGGGDEIVALAAVRIVNGRLLQGETFEALVDPRRSLPEASIAIHGITPDMLAGQPPIEAELPRFRRFAEDSVLVGHNAAFDMRFLQLKEAAAGVRFDGPVLDTLLLSAVVHPAQASHGLDEIAARLGVPVVGRHTALGDALVTGEVFLRLLPLLEARGIRTLGEARAAAEQTYYARVKY